MLSMEIHLITSNANSIADIKAILAPAEITVRNEAVDVLEIQGIIEKITAAQYRRAAGTV
jgi:inosine triphosphate pyrophosphatase